MAEFEKVILTNLVLVYDNDDNILVLDRMKKTWPGITFPGGHVEKDESFLESAIREVWEETGLEISNVKFCGVCQWTNLFGCRYLSFLYKTKDFKGELKPSSEGKVFWIKKKDLFSYKLAEDLEEIFEVIDNDTKSEFIVVQNENGEGISRKIL